MVRAIFEHGVIRPLDALPSYWADGQELVVDEVGDRSSPEDLERWAREMDVLAAEIPPKTSSASKRPSSKPTGRPRPTSAA